VPSVGSAIGVPTRLGNVVQSGEGWCNPGRLPERGGYSACAEESDSLSNRLDPLALQVLEGDFVECGVNRGFLASAIMDYLNWDSLGKHFYLLDTFRGLDERFVSSADRASGAVEKNQKSLTSGFYVQGIEEVRANFSQWKNVSLIEGSIPETLPQIRAKKIAYLHLDMNCSMPEIATIQFVWERLVPGAVVLLDDYAYYGYFSQKLAMDQFAQEKGIKILSLPTGQGLVMKPLDAH
jgi:hypothetical protein